MLIASIVGIVVIILFAVVMNNSVIGKKNEVENSYSGIDVQMTKRYDLIPNIVSTVKQYVEHEKETLTKLTELRTKALSPNMPVNDKIKTDNEISKVLGGLMISVENYPDLKANENFMHLQRTLNEVEEQLAAARRFYNSAVTEYNNALEMFPSNIFASRLRYEKRDLFIAPDVKKQDINVAALF
jgi:LemA protein